MTGSIHSPVSAWHACLSKAAKLQEVSLPHTIYREISLTLYSSAVNGWSWWVFDKHAVLKDLVTIVMMLNNSMHA